MWNRLNKCGLLGVLLIPLLGVLFIGSSASAASEFDDTYQTTDELRLYHDDGPNQCESVDYRLNWSELISTDTPGITQSFVDGFNQALDTGRWGVSYSDFGYGSSIEVFYTTDTSLSLQWINQNGYKYIKTSNSNHAQIFQNPGNNCIPYTPLAQFNSPSIISAYDGSLKNFFIYIDTPNYPVSYEGLPMKDSFEVAPTPEALGMNIHWKVTDKDIQVKDISNYGVSEVEECWLQMPNNVQGDNFTEYFYDCRNPDWISHKMPDTYQQYSIIQFVRIGEDTISKTYNIVIDGTTYDSEVDTRTALEACFNTNFSLTDPWILDWDACTKNIGMVGNLLSFNRLKFGNAWEHESSCKNLVVLDDWLGLDNPQVCPMFGNNVRDVVTPFVTLAIGLTMVSFMTKRSGGGFS